MNQMTNISSKFKYANIKVGGVEESTIHIFYIFSTLKENTRHYIRVLLIYNVYE